MERPQIANAHLFVNDNTKGDQRQRSVNRG